MRCAKRHRDDLPSINWAKDFVDSQSMLDPVFNGRNIVPTCTSTPPSSTTRHQRRAQQGGHPDRPHLGDPLAVERRRGLGIEGRGRRLFEVHGELGFDVELAEISDPQCSGSLDNCSRLPARMTQVKVPFVALDRQHGPLRDELWAVFERVVDAGAFILGEEVARFEDEFAAYCGVLHCVGVGSGTAALTIALQAMGIGPGDEVIVPAHTFTASALGVLHAGATPVFCDFEEETGLMSADAAASALTPQTAAILPVHLYGQCCDMDAISAPADRHGLAILEDAAQAHGATYRARRAGSLAIQLRVQLLPKQEPRRAWRRRCDMHGSRRDRSSSTVAARPRTSSQGPARAHGLQRAPRRVAGSVPAREATSPGVVERGPAPARSGLSRALGRTGWIANGADRESLDLPPVPDSGSESRCSRRVACRCPHPNRCSLLLDSSGPATSRRQRRRLFESPKLGSGRTPAADIRGSDDGRDRADGRRTSKGKAG